MERVEAETLKRIEELAVGWAWEAGEIALRYFRQPLQVEYKAKGDRSPVTAGDREIEAHLRSRIANHFPDHGILGEEQPGRPDIAADFLWVIDPIDGTANFANGLPLFGVSIGVLHRLAPAVGCLYLPPGDLGSLEKAHGGIEASGSSVRRLGSEPSSPVPAGSPSEASLVPGRVLHGRRGCGAFLDDQRVSMAISEKPVPSRLVGLPAHFAWRYRVAPPLRNRLGEVRSTGSITYEMALVSLGVFQYALFSAPKIWDVAAGALLVAEAGGLVLCRERWNQDWQILDRFSLPSGRRGKEGQMADWSAPLLVGSAPAVRFVADNLRHKTPWFAVLSGALRRMAPRK